MKKKEVVSRLRRAYTNANPDVLEAVRQECAQAKEENVIMLNTARKPDVWKKIVAIAAVVLVVGIAAGINAPVKPPIVTTTVGRRRRQKPSFSLTWVFPPTRCGNTLRNR